MRARGFAVCCDAVMACVAGVALLGCAAQAPAARQTLHEGGALYDAASEWQGERAQQVAALSQPQPVPQRPLLMHVFAPDANAVPELNALLTRQHAPIHAVQPIVYAVARARAVPADLINGIIWVESRFQQRARSVKGAGGLMQLMPGTGQEVADVLGLRYRPFDPAFNIDAGTYYFARMVERFAGNLELALAAYNIGPTIVSEWLALGRPLPARSQAYVDNVLAAARVFRAQAPLPPGGGLVARK